MTWSLFSTLRTDGLTCPCCLQAVGAGRLCPDCATTYHPECALALAQCALAGCLGRLGERRGEPPPTDARSKPLRWFFGALGLGVFVLLALLVIPRVTEILIP